MEEMEEINKYIGNKYISKIILNYLCHPIPYDIELKDRTIDIHNITTNNDRYFYQNYFTEMYGKMRIKIDREIKIGYIKKIGYWILS